MKSPIINPQSSILSVDFAGLRLANPVFTASGTCGYAEELADFMDVNRLGGFITKSITRRPRQGNPTPRIVETDAGMLNAIGLANVGLDRFVAEKLPVIAQMSVPVFVNVAGERIEDYVAVTERLAGEPAIAGFELNISCPNVAKGGISFGRDPEQVAGITAAVRRAAGRKVLMVKLSPCVTDISVIARAAVQAGADALSLINTFTAMVIDIETRTPALANRTGGLSGPAVKPIAVYLVNKVYNDVAKKAGIPLLGLGGIRTASDAIEFMLAGASAVAIGTASFSRPDSAVQIIDGIADYCARHQVARIADLVGSLR
ncbi:MAG: dihydroorotate dehydrogenase [Planctomycetes bacterium]|jgi:dihydroorotate dehydrogenase (NAD+) catalytic subunit|nr:dihydroorotate dehydrogenase [Planctomycetota bacterium]